MPFLKRLDQMIARIVTAAQWLALPLMLLLFLQWPLRDLLRTYSREANDLGQIIFAIYVAVSICAATRAGTHLAADTIAQRYSLRTRRRLKQLGATIGILPWALFVLFAAKGLVIASVLGLESFPDTSNPGYFIIKLALWIMAALIITQSVIEFFWPLPADDV
jgi:TRAP-type mannitol/chloroaromatic compound transport system permease small subunit